MSKLLTQKIETATVLGLAEKDYSAFQKGEKSFELWSWLKDEMILCQVYKKNVLLMEPKALARIINVLGSLRERYLTKLDIQIYDSKSAQITFDFDLMTLNNAERRRLNSSYAGLNLEELVEEEPDMTYAHMVG